MDKKSIVKLFAWILSFQIIGMLMGKMTEANITTWYVYLNKSPLNPPTIVFPIAWTLLYIMIAIAGWQLWENRHDKQARLALPFYSIQMIMNWLWTPIFFQLHMMQLGFYWIIGMVFLTLITIFITRNKFKLTTFMLTPYVFWLMFAAYLNGWIWLNN
jgi:benzodiazapine receptor